MQFATTLVVALLAMMSMSAYAQRDACPGMSGSANDCDVPAAEPEPQTFWEEVCDERASDSAVCNWAHRLSNPERMYFGDELADRRVPYIDLRPLADGFPIPEDADPVTISRGEGWNSEAYWPVGDKGVILNVGTANVNNIPFGIWTTPTWRWLPPHHTLTVQVSNRRPEKYRSHEFSTARLQWAKGDKSYDADTYNEWRWRVGRVSVEGRAYFTPHELRDAIHSLFDCLHEGRESMLAEVTTIDSRGVPVRAKVMPDGWCPAPPGDYMLSGPMSNIMLADPAGHAR